MFAADLSVLKTKLKLNGRAFSVTIYSDDKGAMLATPGENPFFPGIINLAAVPREVEEETFGGQPVAAARHELIGLFGADPAPNIPDDKDIRFNVFQANATFLRVGPDGIS